MTDWLRKRREELKLNQEQLAAQLQLAGFDLTRGAISHWENGRFNPPIEDPNFRLALAQILKMSVTSLLKEAGYEVQMELSTNARRAAEIIEQLPPDRQKLALGVLEQFLIEN